MFNLKSEHLLSFPFTFISSNFFFLVLITGNPFVCDCRLNWIYDLRNRTKNIDLRRSLDRMTCTLDKLLYEQAKHTRSNNKFNFDHRVYNDDNLDNYDNELNVFDDLQKSIEGNAMIELRKINVEHLPCTEELSDPTELPLSRESIGMDLSWLSGNGMRTCYFGLWIGIVGLTVCLLVV